ncbi:hypothetical protein E4631_23115 [Hymenobacter sp. UV11]|uniref:hypothetical protein n=1 Tax=Hymenobacter sp. UV11 TaxID=1849735 RepID=UPI0010621F35|nr:hypothetical protein [Hymenobacter sp. UV11]TDN39211.1 hypothetical protein A8B98_20105 [Hymenobacter sp. UV11]TFZ63198.1 hypothetical protein E4631_23115 [Hymenobacter sp. UV11]
MSLPEEIAQTEAAYYQQLADSDLTAAEFDAFLSHLPPKAQLAVAASGFEANRDLLPFRRYVLAQRGQPLAAYLLAELSPAAFAYWQANR